MCGDKINISAYSVCDNITDCIDGIEDEKFCSNLHYLHHPTQICTDIYHAKLNNFGWHCPNISTQPILTYGKEVQNLATLTFDFTTRPIDQSQSDCTNSSRECIYEPNGKKGLNQNDNCLVYCDDFVCHDKYFKCPRFYCVPWRFVCNAQWECPGGTDEMDCGRLSCPGMFKCKNSSVCISFHNLCDDFPDCSTGEDEHFCPSGDNILQPCPLKCSCLLFSVFCKKNSIEWENLALNQITIHLTQSQLPKDRAFLASFDKSFILILRHSKLLFICEQVISLIYIQLLDIPNNLIKHISNNCFQRMNMIRHLTLSFNRISVVSKTNHYF